MNIYKYKIKYWDKKYRFDAIIAITAPYSIARALAKEAKKILNRKDNFMCIKEIYQEIIDGTLE